MRTYLELISTDDAPAFLVLMGMLAIINSHVTRPDAAAYSHARRAAAGVFALHAVLSLIFLPIHSVGDLVPIVVRSALIAGLMYGVAALALGALTATVGDPIRALAGRYRAWRAAARSRKAERLRRLKAEQAERRARRQQAERAPLDEQARREREAAAEVVERQRQERVSGAQGAVTQFYETHALLLEDTLPPLLFRSRMETRFSDSLTGEQAWEIAQAMLAEMLPLVTAGREKQRIAATEREKAEAERAAEELKQRQAADSQHAVTRLSQWFEGEKSRLAEVLTDDLQRDLAIQELHDRFDELLKKTLQEMTP